MQRGFLHYSSDTTLLRKRKSEGHQLRAEDEDEASGMTRIKNWSCLRMARTLYNKINEYKWPWFSWNRRRFQAKRVSLEHERTGSFHYKSRSQNQKTVTSKNRILPLNGSIIITENQKSGISKKPDRAIISVHRHRGKTKLKSANRSGPFCPGNRQ